MKRVFVPLAILTVLLGFAIPAQANTVFLPTFPVDELTTYGQAYDTLTGSWYCEHPQPWDVYSKPRQFILTYTPEPYDEAWIYG